MRAARERDLFTIAVDRNPRALGFPLADRRAVVSTEDEPAVERLARAEAVDGLVSPGSDWPVGIAARVAHRLGLPHPIDPATAVLAATGSSSEKLYVAERPGQVDRHLGSTEKVERLTGWRARTGFETGLERTVAWYRENEVWWRAVLGRDRVSSF